jgi:hypothetical protein
MTHDLCYHGDLPWWRRRYHLGRTRGFTARGTHRMADRAARWEQQLKALPSRWHLPTEDDYDEQVQR